MFYYNSSIFEDMVVEFIVVVLKEFFIGYELMRDVVLLFKVFVSLM